MGALPQRYSARSILELDETSSIGIPHPIALDDKARRAWKDSFGREAIVQPFEQLERELFFVSPGVSGLQTIGESCVTKTSRVLALLRRGWSRGVVRDAGVFERIWYALPGGGRVELDLSPGIPIQAYDIHRAQKVSAARIVGAADNDLTVGALPPEIHSELARTLRTLTA